MRVRVKEGHSLAGATGLVLRNETFYTDSDGNSCVAYEEWFVHLDGEAAPRWIRREMLEEEPVYPKVRDRVAIGCECFRQGSLGSVVQVDRQSEAVLVEFDTSAAREWYDVRDLVYGDAVAAIERAVKTTERAKADAARWAEIEKTKKEMEANHVRLMESLRSGAEAFRVHAKILPRPERLRIAPGWSEAGRVGGRIAPDIEVNGTFYVPLVWEDSGGYPELVLKCTLVPVATPAPESPKPKNERLKGMIYTHRRIGDAMHPRLMRGGVVLTMAQHDEVVRRSNAWGQLERLYQRICDSKDLTAPSVREELGRIVKGGE